MNVKSTVQSQAELWWRWHELTEIGSKRAETVIGHNSGKYDGKPYGGFFTEAGNAGQTAAPLIELDNEFHLKLVDTLHNQYASQLMRSLTEYLNLIRITAWRPSRYQVSNREHIDILNAILERRPEDACRLLSEHIQLSYQEAINTMIHCSF